MSYYIHQNSDNSEILPIDHKDRVRVKVSSVFLLLVMLSIGEVKSLAIMPAMLCIFN